MLRNALAQLGREEGIFVDVNSIASSDQNVIHFPRTPVGQALNRMRPFDDKAETIDVLVVIVIGAQRSISQRAPAGRSARLRNRFWMDRGKYFTMSGSATIRLIPAGPMSNGEYNSFAIGPSFLNSCSPAKPMNGGCACDYFHVSSGFVQQRGGFERALARTNHCNIFSAESFHVALIGSVAHRFRRQPRKLRQALRE